MRTDGCVTPLCAALPPSPTPLDAEVQALLEVLRSTTRNSKTRAYPARFFGCR